MSLSATSLPYIGVIGAARADQDECALAREVGRQLALRGAVLVCGGLGGVMEAACAGAHDGGGLTVGLLPGDERAAANPFVDVAIATGLGELRNGLIVRAVDALVAVGGEWGTLSEIALALETGRVVVGLGSWDLPRKASDAPGRNASGALDRGASWASDAGDGREWRAVIAATDPLDAAERALAQARRSAPAGARDGVSRSS